MRGVRDFRSPPIALTEKDPDVSSTLSPPPPSLSHGPSERDETFVPSSESRGDIYEFLTEEMGRLVVYLKVSFVMTSKQIHSTCPDSHVSEGHLGLLKWPVKVSCTSLKPSVFRSYSATCLGFMSILVVL